MNSLRKPAAMLLFFMLLFNIFTLPAYADDDYSSRTIKVFLPLQFGFAQIDKNGNLSGYTYEYLMHISQLSGWKYEFITADNSNKSLIEGLDQVLNGEIDLVGTMIKPSDAENSDIAYSSQQYGATNFTFIGKANNAKLNARTLHDWPNLKIAVTKKSDTEAEYLEKYARSTNLSYTPVYADSKNECMQLVLEGKADITISKDATHVSGFKTISKIASQPFYFASAKKNEKLIAELDEIITTINLSSPELQNELHRKYFTNSLDYIISLTQEEIEYIKNAEPIRMIVPTNRAPLQYYDEATGKFGGIIIDIIDAIAKKSGLEFELVPADSEEQILSLLGNGHNNMIAGISYHFLSLEKYYKDHLLLTSPVFSSPIVRISNNNNMGKNPETIVGRSIKMFENEANIKYFDDISRIFRLVDSGEYKEAYINGYMAQYYLEKSYLSNTSVAPTTYSNYQLCLGAVRGTDLRLMNILEQSIAALTPEEIEKIVYTNTSRTQQSSLADVFKRNPLPFIIPLTLMLAVIITLLSLLIIKTRHINKIISAEKNRYKEISQTDQLTGTLNNASFKRKCSDYINYCENEPSGAVIMCDIDDFKNINDLYGHMVGDKVIKDFGALLLALCREDDIVGRLGGDEFGLMIKNVSDSEIIAQRCREILEKGQNITSGFKISLSIGAAIFTQRANFEELLKRADNIMYDVKNDGKSNFKLYVYNGTDVNSRI